MDFDDLILCPVCGGQEIPSGWSMCGSCRMQEMYDNDTEGPMLCPKCHSMLIIQHDWRKPVYECQMCQHNWIDPDGEWIDSEE